MLNLRKNFRFATLGLMASTALFITGCSLDDDSAGQQVPLSYVTLYNAVPNAPDFDITVDNRQINSTPFEFGDNTGYLNFYTGTRNIQISPRGASNVVADTTVTLVDGNVYSVFVVDEFPAAEILITNDSAALTKPGKAKIRLVNLSPDSAPVSLKVKDASDNLAANQAFKNASGFIEMTPGEFDFEITSSVGEALQLPDVTLPDGSSRTIIVRGYRTPPAGNTNVISAEIVRN